MADIMRGDYLFTSESVSEGHPDKVADQISDTIVDLFLAKDPEARIACETLTTTQLVVLAGEIRGNGIMDTQGNWSPGVRDEIEAAVRETVRRIGYVAGIYKALQILYSDPALADGWIKRPNKAFGGQSPLERMAAGDVTDLAAVRAYLDAARAPWS